MAEFLIAHSNGIYFNDALWHGLQNYALNGSEDEALTAEERETLTAAERKLRDDQEERWRAYLILRDLVREDLGGISGRFGRAEEVRQARAELRRMSR